MSLFSSHTTIKVDPDLLLEKAAEIEEYASTAGDIYDQIYNMFWNLGTNGQWEGTAFEAMLSASSKNAEKFAPVSERLEEMAAFLRNVANTMLQIDADVAKQVQII